MSLRCSGRKSQSSIACRKRATRVSSSLSEALAPRISDILAAESRSGLAAGESWSQRRRCRLTLMSSLHPSPPHPLPHPLRHRQSRAVSTHSSTLHRAHLCLPAVRPLQTTARRLPIPARPVGKFLFHSLRHDGHGHHHRQSIARAPGASCAASDVRSWTRSRVVDHNTKVERGALCV